MAMRFSPTAIPVSSAPPVTVTGLAGPVHGAVADHDRAAGHGFPAGHDPRRGEHLWHGITSPGVEDDVRPR
jgi:hypothetical protein